MLRFDTTYITDAAIGSEHGLDLTSLEATYGNTLKSGIETLWQSRHTDGAWSKWLNLGEDSSLINQINAYVQKTRGQFEHLVIVGIGGSALGGIAMLEALLPSYWNERTPEQRQHYPRYHFIDNVDPDKLQGLFEILDLKRTLVNVITKSGTTAETMSGYLWLRDAITQVVGRDQIANHLVMTTDAEKGILRKMVTEEGLTAFVVPDDVGGRYSVFSAVGMLPAGLLGLPLDEIQAGIRDMIPTLQSTDIKTNIAAQGALIQYAMNQRGTHISVLMPYSAKLSFVADWYVQLWSESLGKKVDTQGRVVHAGPTPLKAVGVTDQHSQVQLFNEGPFDKIFTFVRLGHFETKMVIPNTYPDVPDLSYLGDQTFEKLLQAEGDATRASLTKNQRPTVTLTIDRLDARHFAQLLFFLEVQTALMGHLLGIDPFDQPGVELAKQYTYALMGRPGFDHLKQDVMPKVTV